MYNLEYTKIFQKDLTKLRQYPALVKNLQNAVDKIKDYPYAAPAEKLLPHHLNRYSLRLNIQHRLVYKVNEDTKTVKLLSCWTHCE